MAAIRSSLAEAVLKLRDNKRAKKMYEGMISNDQDFILSNLGVGNGDMPSSITVMDDIGVKVTATVVSASKLQLDHERLKKALGAAQYNKLCVLQLSNALLESAMATGAVDKNVVAQCAEEVPIKPYVRINESSSPAVKETAVKSGPKKTAVAKRIRP